MPKYCYSTDEETYYGDCDTREEAIESAKEELADDLFDGKAIFWTGEVTTAVELLKRRMDRIVENMLERMEEDLFEEIGGDDDQIIIISPSSVEELGKMILEFVKEHATFNRSGVTKIQEHKEMVGGV